MVMLAVEGITILRIHPLLTWHAAIGIALIPPLVVKMGSTGWRFARYYLGDPRYRRAGPPHPLLRVVGPIVVLTTVVVVATGIAGVLLPSDGYLITWHRLVFFVWFAVMAVHVLGHLVGGARLVHADIRPAPGDNVTHQRVRQGMVLASLVLGVVVALATQGIAAHWLQAHDLQHFHRFGG